MSWLKKVYKVFFCRIKVMQLLHALVFSSGVRREILSMYAGIIAHRRSEDSVSGLVFRLRRNVHRLEKGLIMNPRRSLFALDYIMETVSAYRRVVFEHSLDDAQKKWFHDVLKLYFSVVASHQIIEESRVVFNEVESFDEKGAPLVPVTRSECLFSDISYDDFFLLCKQRRSVRWYEDTVVPRELVDKALLAALQSPTACNRQPFEFRIFDDPRLVKEISSIPGGTVGFTHQFPMIIVVVGRLDAYEFDRDRHLIYIDGSLASMSLMFALETLGLSSCSINWPSVEDLEVKMDKALGLKSFERPVMLISVGYAKKDGLVPFSSKKTLKEVRTYNEI